MKLAGYLDILLWSQAELARKAKVSAQSVGRALNGERVSRRVANAIMQAVSTGLGRKITSDEIEIEVVALKRRRKVSKTGGEGKAVAPSRKHDKQAGELKN